MPVQTSESSLPNAERRFVTIPLPALTPEQSARLSALGIDPSTVPRFLREETLSEAQERELSPFGPLNFPAPSLPPQCSSASGPMEIQNKLDAWCAAGGYENEEFQAFFGLTDD